MIEREFEIIRSMTGNTDILLAAVPVDDWNRELSPWTAPPVHGTESFGGGAADTLLYLLESIVYPLRREGRLFYLGGYSLAGLFALWSACQTDVFTGIAAVSPSVWFPGFVDYMAQCPPRSSAVYLILFSD